MNGYCYVFDVAAVSVTVVVMLSYILRHMTKGRTNRIALAILMSLFLSATGSVIQTYFLNNFSGSQMDIWWVYFGNYIFYVFQHFIPCLFILFTYSSYGLWHVLARNWIITAVIFLSSAINEILILTNPITKSVFYVTDDCVYCRGTLHPVLYVSATVAIMIGVVLIIKYRKIVSHDRTSAMLAFLLINILGSLIQYLWQDILVQSFSMAISFLLFPIVVHRQEEMRDPTIGAKKYNAAISELTVDFATSKPMTLMLVKNSNFANTKIDLGKRNVARVHREISRKLDEISEENKLNSELYYLEDGLFLLVTQVKDKEIVDAVSAELFEEMRKPLNIDGQEYYFDVRVCLVRAPEDISDFVTFYNLALTFHDTLPDNMRLSVLADELMTKEYRVRNELNDIIVRAIKDRRFEMYYQPIYSVKEKAFVSAEALIRLNDEKYGFVSPGLFIPAAEATGAIHQIGDFVLEDVFAFISEHDFDKLGIDHIEINLSIAQCIESNLYDKIMNLIEKYRINPHRIHFEITETAVDYDSATVDRNVLKLNEAGFSFSLDDYGTGYSNIKRVISLPFDLVKLDKSFADEIHNANMKVIINKTIALMKELGKDVLAEGVETEEAFNLFSGESKELLKNCEYVQGYYFSKPLPKEEFIRFIREKNRSNG